MAGDKIQIRFRKKVSKLNQIFGCRTSGINRAKYTYRPINIRKKAETTVDKTSVRKNSKNLCFSKNSGTR
jgi:hypothetical protein